SFTSTVCRSVNTCALTRHPNSLKRDSPVSFQHGEGLAAFAIEIKQHAFTRVRFVQRLAKRCYVRDLLAVHLRDDIFALDVLRGSEAVLGHVRYDHTLGNTEFEPRRDFLRQLLNLQAKL